MKGILHRIITFLICSFLIVLFLGNKSYAVTSEVEQIEILSNPKILQYCVNDTINTKGLSLMVKYTSGETKIVTNGYIVDYDFSTTGEKTVIVSYTENNTTKSTSYKVDVFKRPILSTKDVSINQGSTFKIPVYITENCGIMGLDINVEYDKACLIPLSITNTSFFSNGTIDDSIGTSLSNNFHVIWTGTENIKKDGKIFEIEFLCKQNITNISSKIIISNVKNGTYNQNYADIICDSCNCQVKINSDSVKKNNLDSLAVTMKDWTEDKKASTPKLVGNIGNGKVTYYYAAKATGPYTSVKPKKNGTYYLKAVVEETAKYNKAITTCSFKIKKAPIKSAKPVIKSVSSVKNKKIRITILKRIKDATGYQIRYSTTSNMKHSKIKKIGKTSSKIYLSSLKKKKTYYIQIRAYKKVGKTTYYSKWSSKKKSLGIS